MPKRTDNFTNNFNYSFWEKQTFFSDLDLIVVGSGIVGLSSAISYQLKYPKHKVLILERGMLPSGASTKNAGFACFGSVSELLSDIKKTSESLVYETVEMRIKGLELLKKRLGEKALDYRNYGGYELFDDTLKFEHCSDSIEKLNRDLKQITKSKQTYHVKNKKINTFNFKGINGLIFNEKEGQINTGLMMKHLIEYAHKLGVILLNSVSVNAINDNKNLVRLDTSCREITSKKVIVATNGFAKQLLKIKDLEPARAQVLVTKPIKNLNIKGTFHFDEGYYYFRNIGDRILFGGGRNLDFKTESTTDFKLNPKIQNELVRLLKHRIIPGIPFEIDQQWCGIMGVGSEKKPIIEFVSPNVVCAIRMGGMGVAIGSLVGEKAINLF